MTTTEYLPMNFYSRLRHLAPHGDPLTREPFGDWYPRVRALLPNVPVDVAEHWLHRNWGESPFDYLPIETMSFTEVQWTHGELAKVRFTELWGNTSVLHDTLVKAPETYGNDWLFRHMTSAGTWPAAIIVLDNTQKLVEPVFSRPLPRFVLVEGHRRLEYIRALFTLGKAKSRHAVWLAQMPSATVSQP